MLSRGFRIQADVIIVAASIPSATKSFYAPGQIEVRGGRVVEVTDDLSKSADLNLEGYALLPAWVNPHTHLEFSDLSAPLPAGKHFPDWIASVLAARRQRGPQPEEVLRQTIAAGLQESRAAGVAALVDIVTPPWTPAFLNADLSTGLDWKRLPADLQSQLPLETWQQLQSHLPAPNSGPAVIACLEQLGLNKERLTQTLQWRDRVLSTSSDLLPQRLIALGLSPHAPYSTREPLWEVSFQVAAQQQRLVAMHIAESLAERQWLDSGSGPFAELYAQLAVNVSKPSPDLIAELLHGLAQAPRGLLIHGNYLTPGEIDELSKYQKNVSVVYCPRTHEHFAHAPYPLNDFTLRGIRVVFGTDSRSSNPDLNLWQEARTALSKHKWLRPSAALAAISDSAAEAVGLADRFGSLLPGRVAALNAMPLIPHQRRDDIEELIASWFDNVEHPVSLG